MSNGTAYQKKLKNNSRLKGDERLLFGSIQQKTYKGKNLWTVCKTCKKKGRKSEMGRHQRKYLCYECQPDLLSLISNKTMEIEVGDSEGWVGSRGTAD